MFLFISDTPHRTVSLYARAKNNMAPEPTLQRQSLPDELWLYQSQPVSYCWWSPEASSDSSEDQSFAAQKSSRSMSESLNRKRWSVVHMHLLAIHTPSKGQLLTSVTMYLSLKLISEWTGLVHIALSTIVIVCLMVAPWLSC